MRSIFLQQPDELQMQSFPWWHLNQCLHSLGGHPTVGFVDYVVYIYGIIKTEFYFYDEFESNKLNYDSKLEATWAHLP